MSTATSAMADQACLLVSAGPGYGKTTSLRRLLPAAHHLWADDAVTARVAAGDLSAMPRPAAATGGRRRLVFDDLPELSPATVAGLLDWAAALPAGTGLALGSRILPAGVARWRGRGTLAVWGPNDLALTPDEVHATLRDDFDLGDEELARALHALTVGWPALVRLAGEHLTTWSGPLDRIALELGRPGTPVEQYVADEVLAGLSPAERRLVADLAGCDPVSVELSVACGHRRPGPAFASLVASGVVVTNGLGGHRLVPVVAAVAARLTRPARAATVAGRAAAWYVEHGPPLAAARAQIAAGQAEQAGRTLATHAAEILGGGGAAEFVELVDALPEAARRSELRLCWGDALRAIGDAPRALAVFEQLADELADDHGWPPGLAWRTALVHYLRAEPGPALEILRQAAKAADDPVDDVQVMAWSATAHWMLGEHEAAIDRATAALTLATELGQDRALAAAHTAMALALKVRADAAGVETHYAQALVHARRAGDVVAACRILANQAHELLTRARYPDALVTARTAVAAAERAGPTGLLVVALCNEGEALNRLGRFDEAVHTFRRAISTGHRIGPRRAAGAFVGLGDVHRRRGWLEEARAAYEQATAIARGSREVQALVPALLGLARVLAAHADGPAGLEPAAAALDEAIAAATPSSAAAVQLATGWLALARHDRTAAADAADQALAAARIKPALLAEALELRAAALDDPAAVRAALAEAAHIWQDSGASVDADRLRATVASLPDASTSERFAGSVARRRLTEAGVQPAASTVVCSPSSALAGSGSGSGSGSGGADPGGGAGRAVEVRVLGRFEVRVGDRAVTATEWQSRKARDLLRILVSRRGRIVPREELADILWPGDGGTGHRLSVLLSIVRTTLDPDRAYDSDRYVMGDKSGLALDPTWVRVDVEEFLEGIAYGIRLYEQGDDALARSALSAAVDGYTGDPFDDDPYADWTTTVREYARAAYVRAQRTLARLARRAADPDDAHHRLLAILALDPYDEDAHRTLVATLSAAGRHGEARRAHTRYDEAMRALTH